MNRREFLKTLGLTAAAVSFAPSALTETAPVAADAGLDELLRVGDVFTIEGRYALNPITRTTTNVLQKFIVTSVSSDRAELGFHPTLKGGNEFWPPIQPRDVLR